MVHAIEIQNLSVKYKDTLALKDLNLTVNEGETYGFLGPNGAGKSTAIKSLLGLIFPQSGLIKIRGKSCEDMQTKSIIGYLPEETTYYRFLSPVEILQFYSEIFKIPRQKSKARIEQLLEMVGLSHVAHKSLGTFSKGMTQKIGLAQCLINDPEILILDEPTSGLDPLARLELRRLLERFKKEGKTIFFSSHELSEVELICDSIALVHKGRTVKQGRLNEILQSSEESSLEKLFLKTVQESS